MKWTSILLLACSSTVVTARAQTSADTTAIDSILFAFVVRDLRLGGDHRPPVRLPRLSDESTWSGRIYTKLRSEYPELVTVDTADTVRRDRPGLTLTVSVRGFRADSGEAIISWSRCTTRPTMLNAWTHDAYFTLKKESAGWVFLSSGFGIGDGRC